MGEEGWDGWVSVIMDLFSVKFVEVGLGLVRYLVLGKVMYVWRFTIFEDKHSYWFFVMGWESAHKYISLIKCILQSIKGYLD